MTEVGGGRRSQSLVREALGLWAGTSMWALEAPADDSITRGGLPAMHVPTPAGRREHLTPWAGC
jgi:hypothetical protein